MTNQETSAYLSGYEACKNDVEAVIESVLRKGNNAKSIHGLVEAFNELQEFLWGLNTKTKEPDTSNEYVADGDDGIADVVEKMLMENGLSGKIVVVTVNDKK